ncbi:hypothetical protein Lal_00024235 [Lupinus albus]|nr:hypothetical protein Lal_00024235 [Lupinus albus]
MKNVFAMKYILRLFEACSGLKVNFSKYSLSCIKISSSFLYGSWPIKFLRIPVGANYKRKEVWKDMLSNMPNRLSLWKGRYLSFDGRCVIQAMIRIQRDFLWGGVGVHRKIPWDHSKGGMGVKYIESFNLALLDGAKVDGVGEGGSLESLGWRDLKKVVGRSDNSLGGSTMVLKGWWGTRVLLDFGRIFWVGEGPLKDSFEILYNLSSVKRALVGKLGV